MSFKCQAPPLSCHVCRALYVSVFFYSVRCRAMYVLSCINCVVPWGMSCNVSCVDVCRAVSWHDILYLHGTAWGMSCNVSCHAVEFGDVVLVESFPFCYDCWRLFPIFSLAGWTDPTGCTSLLFEMSCCHPRNKHYLKTPDFGALARSWV